MYAEGLPPLQHKAKAKELVGNHQFPLSPRPSPASIKSFRLSVPHTHRRSQLCWEKGQFVNTSNKSPSEDKDVNRHPITFRPARPRQVQGTSPSHHSHWRLPPLACRFHVSLASPTASSLWDKPAPPRTKEAEGGGTKASLPRLRGKGGSAVVG